MIKKSTLLFLLLALTSSGIKAQLSGPYTVPGSYASIAAAITDLNTVGVSGPVVINIAAGYTETAPVGGYTLNAISGASSINQITFQKSGAGANPLISAYTGTATPASATQDGIWRFVGSDFVTIDAIDLADPNTANPATMEFGYGFFKASVTNGCQNNTIKNCVITLNRLNNAAGSGPAVDGSRGIDVVNASSSAHTTALTITSATGANSNNKFYTNTIQNCNIGIALIGYADSSPFNNADSGNDIGGTSSLTGNTIVNFGGGGTSSAAAGIRTLAQYAVNVSYNLLNNNNGSGLNHAQDLRGIYLNTATSAGATISNNTLTLNGGGTSNQLIPIQNASGSTAASNSITIVNNLISNCTYPTATSGIFYGIYNTASAAFLSVTGNTLVNNSTNATSGSYFNIYNTGAVTTLINLSNNLVNLGTFNAVSTSLELTGVYNNAGASTSTLNVLNNTIQSANFAGATGGTGTNEMIYNSGVRAVTNINNNNFNNITLKSSGTTYLIYNSSSTINTNTNNNFITTGFARTVAGTNNFFGYYNFGSPGSGSAVFTGNNFSNISSLGTGIFYGLYQATSTSQVEIFNNNIIANVTASTSVVNALYHNYGAAGSAITGNTVTNITGASVNAIIIGNSSASSGLVVSGNVVSSCTAVANTGQAVGIFHVAGNASNIFKNKVYDLAGIGTTNVVSGIYISAGGVINIYNNLVGDLKTPFTGGIPISGLYLGAATTINAHYNSVYLSASSSGANFGSIAVFGSTTPVITLRNNIFVNNSTATGTGTVIAYYRSGTSLVNYSSASNNNLFYAGIPSAANLLYYDGNSIQTLAALKAFLVNRDAASITENPTFVSLSGASVNFLNINAVVPTQIEGGGIPVSGVSDDVAGNLRNVATPDIGAWEGNYLFNDITAPQMPSSGFTTPACILSGRTFTANFSDVSGVAGGLLSPRIYYKVNSGAYSSAAGVLSTGTASNGVWTFNLVYSASISDLISYYVVVQDAYTTPNLTAFPAAGFSGTDVNTVSTNPTTPFTYGVNSLNGVYTVGSTGTFTSLTAASIAYNTFVSLVR